jgi:hypothetical protein
LSMQKGGEGRAVGRRGQPPPHPPPRSRSGREESPASASSNLWLLSLRFSP